MANIMANLKTFQPEYGIGTNEPLFHLRSYAKGLMVNACAHALFFCKLLNATKQKEENCKDAPAGSQPSKDNQRLKIGIIGGGHLGKQLARTLLHLGAISGKNIQISTRQPETLLEFHKLGVECIYNNKQLVGWADVAFLCCLPCHLPQICSEVQDSLKNSCIIYSLVTAIPLSRLKQLISSCSILRPQYKCSENSSFHMWEANRTVLEALKNTTIIQATCPCNSKSEITVNVKWLAAVFYAALNSYTQQHFSYTKALGLLNQVCFCEGNATTSSPFLVCEHFINQAFASSLAADDSFPWFDITTVQLKDSPLSQLLETNSSLQEIIASSYFNMITALAMKSEDLTTSMTKKIPLSAVLLKPTKSLIFQIDKIPAKKIEETSSIDSEDS
ncbi:NADP-dependent oxidoreductase domain-containing protein 1 [Protobothrops mucrosquamatus]|uniref:NADP-dependent oxidoreductase domain-containing protein 1 n=1 Tax=Protobothrops mucrosquamatus TaxID=103944 RepID=UPI0010FAEFBA|nr:NADP-dependent oxidoreductase domain-containing protein 1 [Protobothrops mucrosquamatus]